MSTTVVVAPAKISWRKKFGHILGNVLKWTDKVDQVIQPEADVLLLATGGPAVVNLFNLFVDVIHRTQAVTDAPGASLPKFQLALAALQGDIIAFEQKFNATADQQKMTQAVIDFLDSLTFNTPTIALPASVALPTAPVPTH